MAIVVAMIIPSWAHIVALSMAPITEYQLAIPIAITTYGYSPFVAYVLSVAGSFIPFFPLYFGFASARDHVARAFPRLVAPFDMLLARAQKKVQGNYDRYGAIALFLALVVPFPLTGVWTMTLAAVALKIPKHSAAISIFLGLLCGALLVTLASLGIVSFF